MNADYRTVYFHDDGLRIDLQAADIVTEDGRARRLHRLVTGAGAGAVVIGVRAGDGGVEILFVSSRRDAVRGTLLELPRGWAETEDDLDERPLVAAALRELAEETGFHGSDARLLGGVVIDSSVYPQRVGIVEAFIDGPPSAETDGEADANVWLRPVRVRELVRDGVICDALTLSALALWAAAGPRDGEVERA